MAPRAATRRRPWQRSPPARSARTWLPRAPSSKCPDRGVQRSQRILAPHAHIIVVLLADQSLQHAHGGGILISDQQVNHLNAHASVLVFEQHLRQRLAYFRVGRETL